MYCKNAASGFNLCHMAHVLMENRNGLAVAARVSNFVAPGGMERRLTDVAPGDSGTSGHGRSRQGLR